jgi:RecJ-like exonuclease
VEAAGKKLLLSKALQKRVAPCPAPLWVDDGCMRALAPVVNQAAQFIKEQVVSGRPVFLRYNSDTDGITAALMVESSLMQVAKENGVQLKLRDVASPPAVYERGKAVAEARYYEELGVSPLALLVDHAANPESVAALEHLKGLGFAIVIVDHHPPDPRVKGLVDYFISPFGVGVAESKYCSGLLCFQLALAVCGTADEELLSYALYADASTLSRGPRLQQALAIDYYAQTSPSAKLSDYRQLAESADQLRQLYLMASRALEAAANVAWQQCKVEEESGWVVATSDFNGAIRKRTFPSKGVVLNVIHAKVIAQSPAKPVVSVCYVGDSIGFRANRLAIDAGFDANKLIAAIKSSLPRVLRNGGGHAAAASMQVAEEADRLRVRELALQITKSQLSPKQA